MKNESKLGSYCSDAKMLAEYLQRKAQNHNSYKMYSMIDRIIQIRDEKLLYLNDGKKWNDKTDRDSFNPVTSDTINFGKCFSFSQDENVAMWMLYGGIDKCSGMIDFTKKGIHSILNIDSVETGFFLITHFIL